jgi:hypothetical protein
VRGGASIPLVASLDSHIASCAVFAVDRELLTVTVVLMTGLLQISVQFSSVFKPECVPALEYGVQRDVRSGSVSLNLPPVAYSIRPTVTFVTPMTELLAASCSP